MKKKAQSFNTRQEMFSDTYEVFHYHDARFQEVPLHHHNFYEIYLFINGQVDYRIEAEVFSLKPRDLLVIPPGVFHQPLVSSNKPYERIVLWIQREYLENIIDNPELLTCFTNNNFILHSGNSYDLFYNHLLSLINIEDDFLKNEYSKSLLLLLLIEVNRLSIRHDPYKEIKQTNQTITSVLNYINNNFIENISLDNLAHKFYIDKYYLSHLFTKEVGTSIHRYINLKRLLYARELLDGGLSPKEACLKSGFNDYTNFYRAYKNEYGVTPKIHSNKQSHP